MPALSSLETEGLILAVGEGMATTPLAIPVSGSGKTIPAAAVRGVCLMAIGPEEEFTPPRSAASAPVSTPPALVTTLVQGRPLTATVVVSAERRARRARENRLPYRCLQERMRKWKGSTYPCCFRDGIERPPTCAPSIRNRTRMCGCL
jgi:hypothetical protein